MKIVLVHDDLLQWGGAERVLQAMHQLWPTAPIYTSVADENVQRRYFPKATIITSPLQKIASVRKFRRAHLPFYPWAFQSFTIDPTDIVLSSTTRFAHSIKKPAGAKHVAYFHAPPRFLWDLDTYLLHERFGAIKKLAVRPLLKPFATYDKRSASRVDYFIANSSNTAAKIKFLYGQRSTTIHPFVDTAIFKPHASIKNQDYYLIVSRLLPWKRIDIAIKACKEIGRPLVIIGKGPDEGHLRHVARGADVTFISDLTDTELATYYRKCRALIMTQNEDFGMAALEAMACGRPVIAYKSGGALETITKGITGDFFTSQDSQALMKTIKKFETNTFDATVITEHARTFSKAAFYTTLQRYIERLAFQK